MPILASVESECEHVKQPFYEEVYERLGGKIIRSTIRPATNQEVCDAKRIYTETGKCNHHLIYDEKGYIFDHRMCFTCGASLGLI